MERGQVHVIWPPEASAPPGEGRRVRKRPSRCRSPTALFPFHLGREDKQGLESDLPQGHKEDDLKDQ